MAPGIAEKKNNVLPLWGNEKTMNLNNLILTNILSSHYFKVNLYQLKTYHEVIDEIYYQVTHLEPWEKGSRKTSGQTGMCGGVRGVGAGGIVSTAFCILYKLFTLKLTRKQVVGLINHSDSAYIRALGFMYIRYTQPPSDLWDWYENYLSDKEEIDVKAGGGQVMSIGEMLRHFLSKLEWFSTLFPRIPVPIQKDLERKLTNWRNHSKDKNFSNVSENADDPEHLSSKDDEWTDNTTNQWRSHESEDLKEGLDNEEEEDKIDIAEEIAKEKERQKREKEKPVSSHHRSLHYKEYSSNSRRSRSRSPLRVRDDDRKYSKKHRNKERDPSSERRHHKSHDASRYKSSDRESESRHLKDKSHDRRKERKHDHSHSHEHTRGHDKHSHSRRDY